MAFPRKYSRRIVIHDETYLWYLKRNEIWMDSKHIAIRHAGSPNGQLLLLDCYAYDFEFGPGTIREVVIFALANGWMPRQKAMPLYIGFDNRRFVRLPPGEQYLRRYPQTATDSPDNSR